MSLAVVCLDTQKLVKADLHAVAWIRGLFEAWSRMKAESDVAMFVQSYLYVQV